MVEEGNVLEDSGFRFGEDIDHIFMIFFDIIGIMDHHLCQTRNGHFIQIPKQH